MTKDNDGQDIFVHFRSISSGGFKTLLEGQRVNFEVEPGDKGTQATKVALI
ncbi:cold-shock protein [Photobacterium sp. R1]